MNRQTLISAMGNEVISDEETAAYNQALTDAECTTIERAAQFAAQTGHECVGMRTYEEYASGAAYEGRKDLGNVFPGDGVRYKGRGIIQLTGRTNYRSFSEWAHRKGRVSSPTYFEDNPAEVGKLPWAFIAASWYWTVARPMNALIDKGDGAVWGSYRGFEAVTAAINGGTNGLADRRERYTRCLRLGAALLPDAIERKPVVEKVLDYERTIVTQDTFYWCGPATVQNILNNRKINRSEADLAREMGTTINGTDHIGLLTGALNRALPDAKYATVQIPNDPPSAAQRDTLWNNIVRSINAGYGVAINIDAPPSNYPKAVYPSTISPAYGGDEVLHYFAAMGYREDNGVRAVWIADSGFTPYGYWVSLEQLATLIPPKGYAYATGGVPVAPNQGGFLMALTEQQQQEIYFELRTEFPSMFIDADGKPSQFKGTLGRYIQLTDAKVEAMRLRQVEQDRKVDETLRLVQAMAAKAGVK